MKTLKKQELIYGWIFSPCLTALLEVVEIREKEPIGGDFTKNMTW